MGTPPTLPSVAPLAAPFPWFGGKSRAAPAIWERLGRVKNYVEPFFGSGAVLLGRPGPIAGPETINDLDGFVANAWRAIRSQPAATADFADNPVSENDLHARHVWLAARRAELRPRLEADPEWCDPQIAGWWLWGISCWIGAGWCSGAGPWRVVDGMLVAVDGSAGLGVKRSRPHLGTGGRGVNRDIDLQIYFAALSLRLAGVRVASGDWSRVLGPSVTSHNGLTGIVLDPPYSSRRVPDLYSEDSMVVAHAVREWALANGDNPLLRIALCGYEGEHAMPGWTVHAWAAPPGYGAQAEVRSGNGLLERIWFSPHCLAARQLSLL